MNFGASLVSAQVLTRATVTSLQHDGVMVVYSSSFSMGDERGLVYSKLSMFIWYLAAKESPLNENNGNWSIDGHLRSEMATLVKGLLQQVSLSLWAMATC